MKNSWRPIAAYVYLLICLCDFAVMPVYYTVHSSSRVMDREQVELALRFKDPTTQLEVLRTIRESGSWQPLTLQQSGLFHMAFGAILGVAAWTRGQEKVEAIKAGVNPDDPTPTPTPESGDTGNA